MTHRPSRPPSVRAKPALAAALLLLTTGCAGQHALTAGEAYVHAQAEVLPLVGDALAMSERSSRRASALASVGLPMPAQSGEEVRKLACAPRGERLALGYVVRNGLEAYGATIAQLAATPDDTWAATLAALAADLPAAPDLAAAVKDSDALDAKRVAACAGFVSAAAAAAKEEEDSRHGGGIRTLGVDALTRKSALAVLDFLKSGLRLAEANRRGVAYARIAKEVDPAIAIHWAMLGAGLDVELKLAAHRSLQLAEFQRALAADAGRPAAERFAAVGGLQTSLEDFDHAYALHRVFYAQDAAQHDTFARLANAHAAVAAIAAGGHGDWGTALDDLVQLLNYLEQSKQSLDAFP